MARPDRTQRMPADAPIASKTSATDASLAAASYTLDPDLKGQLDDLTYEYRLGDAAR